jgi:hypothetical protein
VKKRAFLYSLCATAMAVSGLALGAAPASASISNTPGYFHIVNAGSGKCIDATYPNNDLSAGYAQQWRCLNTAFEEWKFVPWFDAYGYSHPGVFQIVNGYTGQCLAPPDTEPQNGTLLTMQPCGAYGADQQAWTTAAGGPVPGYQPLVSETYGANGTVGTRCLDLQNGDTSDGVPMQVWDCTPNTNNQQWSRISNSDGGGGGGGGCATSTPSSVHPAAIRPHRITCP